MQEPLKLIDRTTKGRYDVTPLFANYDAFNSVVVDLLKQLKDMDFDLVAGIDALGFILATAIALKTEKGVLTVRKGGKLPGEVDGVHFIDYSGSTKTLEIRKDAIRPGQRVLIVDEWMETGAQMFATVGLIEKRGGIIAGIVSLNIDDSKNSERCRDLKERYPCFTPLDE